MTYTFVQAAFDYGVRKGPVQAFLVHMAEGGGTVGFLAGDPARGVSVHYVIEYSGRIVQMLVESHASGSLNPAIIRTDDDADGFYGATAAKAVMGTWWSDPNSAVISVEIEGFAATGPNQYQATALANLVNDVRSRYPGIGLLGHRDFQNEKACPGHHIAWDQLGGHGPANGGTDVRFVKAIDGKVLNVSAGYPWKYLDGTPGGTFSKAATVAILGTVDAHSNQYVARISTAGPYADGVSRPTDVLIVTTSALVSAPVPAPPAPDPAVIAAAVNAALDHVAAAHLVEGTAIDEARIR